MSTRTGINRGRESERDAAAPPFFHSYPSPPSFLSLLSASSTPPCESCLATARLRRLSFSSSSSLFSSSTFFFLVCLTQVSWVTGTFREESPASLCLLSLHLYSFSRFFYVYVQSILCGPHDGAFGMTSLPFRLPSASFRTLPSHYFMNPCLHKAAAEGFQKRALTGSQFEAQRGIQYKQTFNICQTDCSKEKRWNM